MSPVPFDILAYSNRLQKSGIPREQADAMAQANADAFKDMTVTQQLATRQDIALVKEDIFLVKQEIAEVRHEILKWMVTAMLAQTALLVGIIAFLK